MDKMLAPRTQYPVPAATTYSSKTSNNLGPLTIFRCVRIVLPVEARGRTRQQAGLKRGRAVSASQRKRKRPGRGGQEHGDKQSAEL